SRALAYNVIAAVVLPAAFVVAAAVAPAAGFLAVAWAWAIGYPIAFVALLVLALPASGLGAGAYLRAQIGIVGCAAVALGAALGAKLLVPDVAALRASAAAAVVVVVYAALLAKIEKVTPRGIWRALRGRATA